MAQKLIVFEPGLPDTPGWVGLSEADKQAMQEITSDVKKFGAGESLMSVNVGLKLLEGKRRLEGKTMTVSNWLRTVYGGSERRGFDKVTAMEELVTIWPDYLIRAVAERGALLLRGTAGIQLGDILLVAKDLPAPKELDDKTIDAFIEHKVRAKLKEHRTMRRIGKVVKLSESAGLKMIFNDGRRRFRAMKGLNTSADRKQAIRSIVGWWMQDLAIPGTIECTRISPLPEGLIAKVGYPRGRKRKKD